MRFQHLLEDVQQVNSFRNTVAALGQIKSYTEALRLLRDLGAFPIATGFSGGVVDRKDQHIESVALRSSEGPLIAKIYPDKDRLFTRYRDLCVEARGGNQHLLRFHGDLITFYDDDEGETFHISFSEYVDIIPIAAKKNSKAAAIFYPFMMADGPMGLDFYDRGTTLRDALNQYSTSGEAWPELEQLFERLPSFKQFIDLVDARISGLESNDIHPHNVGLRPKGGDIVVLDPVY